MAILLALGSALVYGVGDYCGGRASRTNPSTIVTLLGQAASLVFVVVAVLGVGTPVPGFADLVWGGTAGAAGAAALVMFYWALGHGAMTVVAPTTAVIGAVVPVVAGLVQGERPHALALVGIVVAIACVALVSGLGEADPQEHRATPPRVLVAALLAGVGFGSLFVLLSHTSDDSGLWPLVAARLVSVPILVVLVTATRARPGGDRRILGLAVLTGILDMTANVLYLGAVRRGLLSIVAVISSLYPASTVAMAFAIDRERVTRSQAIGLGLAAVALVLVTLGRS
ncbi:MAG: DMT family transporter [Ilumatobacteraceae bacterium]